MSCMSAQIILISLNLICVVFGTSKDTNDDNQGKSPFANACFVYFLMIIAAFHFVTDKIFVQPMQTTPRWYYAGMGIRLMYLHKAAVFVSIISWAIVAGNDFLLCMAIFPWITAGVVYLLQLQLREIKDGPFHSNSMKTIGLIFLLQDIMVVVGSIWIKYLSIQTSNFEMTVNDITVEINLSILYGVYLGLDTVLLCKRASYENVWGNKIFSFNTLERTPIFDVCGAPFIILSTKCTNRKFFSRKYFKDMNGKLLRDKFAVDDTIANLIIRWYKKPYLLYFSCQFIF